MTAPRPSRRCVRSPGGGGAPAARAGRPCAARPPAALRQRRPLGDLNTAMRDLDLNADAVRTLLDQGRLIGFNIAIRPRTRTALRVLTRSLDHYWETGDRLALAWPDIFRLISPGEKMFLLGVEVQRSLNCEEGHVAAMIEAGHLKRVRRARRGQAGSPVITRHSIEAFLKNRRL